MDLWVRAVYKNNWNLLYIYASTNLAIPLIYSLQNILYLMLYNKAHMF